MEENDGDFAVFVYIWTVNKELFYQQGNNVWKRK